MERLQILVEIHQRDKVVQYSMRNHVGYLTHIADVTRPVTTQKEQHMRNQRSHLNSCPHGTSQGAGY